MIKKADAITIAQKHIEEIQKESRANLTLTLVGEIRETTYGWVFFYNSQKFIETGDFSYALGGNSPFMVLKEDGRIVSTGTAHPLEFYLKKIEHELRSKEMQ